MVTVTLFLLSALAAPIAAAQSFAELAADASPGREQRLLEGARKEASVNLYTSNAAPTIHALAADFEKRYGVRVNLWRASSVKVLQRLLAEKQARRWEFDAVSISAPKLEALYREGLLQETHSAAHGEMIDGAMPAHRGWAPQFINVFVQAYNTRAVPRDELPQQWSELLDPRWKGKLGVEANAAEWYCALAQRGGADVLTRIAATNGLSVRQGNSVLANMVVTGEVPLALAVYGHMIAQAKAQGAPVESFALGPPIARANGIGVSRQPAHPHAALLFYEYNLGAAQPILVELQYMSPLRRWATAARLVFVDPTMDGAALARCNNAYAALLKGQAWR